MVKFVKAAWSMKEAWRTFFLYPKNMKELMDPHENHEWGLWCTLHFGRWKFQITSLWSTIPKISKQKISQLNRTSIDTHICMSSLTYDESLSVWFQFFFLAQNFWINHFLLRTRFVCFFFVLLRRIFSFVDTSFVCLGRGYHLCFFRSSIPLLFL